MAGKGRVFVTKQFDKPIYQLLQQLRVVHTSDLGDMDQWSILQASLVSFAALPSEQRRSFLEQVRTAPVDQPAYYVAP